MAHRRASARPLAALLLAALACAMTVQASRLIDLDMMEAAGADEHTAERSLLQLDNPPPSPRPPRMPKPPRPPPKPFSPRPPPKPPGNPPPSPGGQTLPTYGDSSPPPVYNTLPGVDPPPSPRPPVLRPPPRMPTSPSPTPSPSSYPNTLPDVPSYGDPSPIPNTLPGVDPMPSPPSPRPPRPPPRPPRMPPSPPSPRPPRPPRPPPRPPRNPPPSPPTYGEDPSPIPNTLPSEDPSPSPPSPRPPRPPPRPPRNPPSNTLPSEDPSPEPSPPPPPPVPSEPGEPEEPTDAPSPSWRDIPKESVTLSDGTKYERKCLGEGGWIRANMVDITPNPIVMPTPNLDNNVAANTLACEELCVKNKKCWSFMYRTEGKCFLLRARGRMDGFPWDPTAEKYDTSRACQLWRPQAAGRRRKAMTRKQLA